MRCNRAEKAAEVRAQAVDAAAAARATSGQTDLPADSRSASIHLCGFDIQGVSIAGQVRAVHTVQPLLPVEVTEPALLQQQQQQQGCLQHAWH